MTYGIHNYLDHIYREDDCIISHTFIITTLNSRFIPTDDHSLPSFKITLNSREGVVPWVSLKAASDR